MIDQKLFIEHSPTLYNIGKQLADAYKAELRTADAVASGSLVQFRWDVKLEKNGLKLVYYLPEHWRYIEYGRRPTKNRGDGSVYKSIYNWILDKGITPKARYNSKGVKYIPTQKQLAFLITRKIHSEGYFSPNHQGKHPLEKAMQKTKTLQQQFVDTATKMFTDQVKDLIVMLNTTK